MHIIPDHYRSLSTLSVAAAFGLLITGLAACGDDAERDPETGAISEAGDADVFELVVGDCMDDEMSGGESAEFDAVAARPCDDPHDNEVYLSHMIEDSEFPDPDRMAAIGDEACTPSFEQFVGIPYEESTLDWWAMEPTGDSWDGGDRELLCLVYDPAGQVSGTLQGSNR